MNKTAIKNFAVWARRKLISEITYKAGLYGVSESGVTQAVEPAHGVQVIPLGKAGQTEISGSDIAQRNAFIDAVNAKAHEMDFAAAFRCVVEDVAYTWFNRLIAIRFMEVNDYLPSRVRVLSSENVAKAEPDFVTTPFDTDLDFSQQERTSVYRMKDDNKLDELFRMLFIKQCNKLHDILPKLFEKTADYTELLLTISFTDKDGVVWHLTHDIPEDDFNVSKQGQVEIIGWLYQYYNTEPKDEVFALLKKNVKITKERIPAATQLFTPDWIVRYMIENSLGRLWVEGHPNAALQSGWKYYLEEAEQEPSVQEQLAKLRAEYKALQPEDIKVIDPCMGSGHILVYAFDVLMQIYEAQGYAQRDAARLIVEKNLYGLDIDRRAYQLAYFAVLMKARQYNRRILTEGVQPNLFAIQDSSALTDGMIAYIAGGDGKLRTAMQSIRDDLTNATEYGSIIDIAPVDFAALYARFEAMQHTVPADMVEKAMQKECFAVAWPLVRQARCMAQKYEVVCTNPPYMGSSGMSARLADYVKAKYPDSKSDLFAAFIERCWQMTAQNCYQAMITQHAWMFLSSFEKLRSKLLKCDTVNMAHLGARAFEEIGGEVVQTTAFVLRNSLEMGYKGTYCRLIEPTTQQGKEDMFLAGENRFTACQDNFTKIPGAPVAYWLSKKVFSLYENGLTMESIAHPKVGMQTSNNDKYLRMWFEIDYSEFNGSSRGLIWIKYLKGGSYRKWYGNLEYLVHYNLEPSYILSQQNARVLDLSYLDKRKCTWTDLTSGSNSFRYAPEDTFYDISGHCYFPSENDQYWLLGYSNTKIFSMLKTVFNSTFHCQVGDVAKIVVPILGEEQREEITCLAKDAVTLSRSDWDSFETSWDFKRHPLCWGMGLMAGTRNQRGDSQYLLSMTFAAWEKICSDRFNKLKQNEEELNRIFIDIYGLQDELTPDVADKDVTVRHADLGRDICSLVSYAVGCMLGRYSLDVEGLAYAGGKWDSSKYTTFLPDPDNCIPITDEEYFEDDIVGRFVAFIRTVYGADTLEENLDFIANALGNKGNTSREIIRNYFLNDFIKDHIKNYQKRPIYWLFDSGKQNGFKALVYMHRWNADTMGNVRVEYLFRMQKTYEREIARMQEIMDDSTNAREVAAAEKRKEKLVKQLKETRDYDAKIAHLALSRIDIDLDEGVKVNYQKVQTGQDGKMLDVLAKI